MVIKINFRIVCIVIWWYGCYLAIFVIFYHIDGNRKCAECWNKKTEIVCITIWSFYGHYREYKLAIHIFKYYTKTIKGDTMTGSFVLCLSIYICSTWIVGFIFQTWYKMKSMTGLHIFVQIKSFYDFGHIGRDIVTKVHHIYIPNDSLTLLASICISWILKILFWQYHFNLNIKSWIWQNATPSILHNIIYTRQVYTAYHFA